MKRQIRRGCFETNSSSAHSIVVMKGEGSHVSKEELRNTRIPEHIYISSNGNWEVTFNTNDLEFGRWPFEILTTFKDKFRYAVACYGLTDELIDIAKRVSDGEIKEIELPLINKEYYLDENDNRLSYADMEFDYDDDCYYYVRHGIKKRAKRSIELVSYEGGIDHQSEGLLSLFLGHRNISLEEFLTNKKYKVIIDGDEYCFFDNAVYSGLINKDAIEFVATPWKVVAEEEVEEYDQTVGN